MNKDNPTILIIGISGQLGNHAWEQLKLTPNVYGTLRKPINDSSENILALDLTNPEEISVVLHKLKPDIIINCAAYTKVDQAESDTALNYAVNRDAPAKIAAIAKELNSLLIHISTDYVFAGTGETPQSETQETGPVNKYGSAKLAGEEAIKENCDNYIILRTSWVYSADGNNFLNTMIRLGSEREYLSIVDDQIGSPTSVKVIFDGISKVIEHYLKDQETFYSSLVGIYHLTCREYTSWFGFTQEIFNTARLMDPTFTPPKLSPIPSSNYPTPASRPLNSRLLCKKFEESFSHELPTWQEALKITLKQKYP